MSPPAETVPDPPAARIRRIEQSMACFVSGLFALVPVVGLPMAVLGLAQFRDSRPGSDRDWNPVARYRSWGGWLSILGLTLHIAAIAALSLILAWQWAG